MVVVSHRIGDEDSLIDNIYHSSEHTPQQNDEGEATNSAEKLNLESCELQNDQPLVSHGNVVKLVVVGDHQEHTIDFVKTENPHANRTDDSHYKDFSTVMFLSGCHKAFQLLHIVLLLLVTVEECHFYI